MAIQNGGMDGLEGPETAFESNESGLFPCSIIVSIFLPNMTASICNPKPLDSMSKGAISDLGNA